MNIANRFANFLQVTENIEEVKEIYNVHIKDILWLKPLACETIGVQEATLVLFKDESGVMLYVKNGEHCYTVMDDSEVKKLLLFLSIAKGLQP